MEELIQHSMKSLSQANCQRVHSLFGNSLNAKSPPLNWQKEYKAERNHVSVRFHRAGNQRRNWSGFVSPSCPLHCCSAEHTPGLRLSAAVLHCCLQYLYAGRPLPLHSPQSGTHNPGNDQMYLHCTKRVSLIFYYVAVFYKSNKGTCFQTGVQ